MTPSPRALIYIHGMSLGFLGSKQAQTFTVLGHLKEKPISVLVRDSWDHLLLSLLPSQWPRCHLCGCHKWRTGSFSGSRTSCRPKDTSKGTTSGHHWPKILRWDICSADNSKTEASRWRDIFVGRDILQTWSRTFGQFESKNWLWKKKSDFCYSAISTPLKRSLF